MPRTRPAPMPSPSGALPSRTEEGAAAFSVKYTAKYLRVLDAAARQFSEKGYHVATTKDIAESLGVQQGSLYYYIRSKEAALEQICFVAMKGYVDFSAGILRSRKPTTEKIEELVFRHLQTLDERPDFFRVFLAHRQELSTEPRHALGRQIREYEANVEGILRQGVRRGELRADCDCRIAALGLMGMCNAVVGWHTKRGSQPVRDIAVELSRMVVDGLRAPVLKVR